MLKVCTRCSIEQPLSAFHKHKPSKDGVKAACRKCRKSESQVTYVNNREKILERQKQYSQDNKEQISEQKARHYQANKEYVKTRVARWAQLNRSKCNSYGATYRAAKIKATPAWLSAKHKQDIEEIYWMARDCTVTSGEEYQVDHIVPLRGHNVCGLHVPWNLQVLPAFANQMKSNKEPFWFKC